MSQGTQAFLRGETESEDYAGAPARCPVRIGDRFRRTAPGYTAEDGFNRITLMWTVIYINAATGITPPRRRSTGTACGRATALKKNRTHRQEDKTCKRNLPRWI